MNILIALSRTDFESLFFYFLFAGSTLIDLPLIFTFFIASNTSDATSRGTSTKVYLSYKSIVPTKLPEIPDYPAIAPKISPGRIPCFFPMLINRRTIPSSAPVSPKSSLLLPASLPSAVPRISARKAAATSIAV